MTSISLREIQREFKPFGILVRPYRGYFQALNIDNRGTSIQAESLILLRPAIYRALDIWLTQ